MAVNSIGGVALSTYGLRLMKLDNHLSLPPYKNILTEHSLPENMRFLNEKEFTVRMFGEYQTKELLGQNMELFKAKVKSGVVLSWDFPDHGFTKNCVAKNGAQITPYGTCVEITIKLTVTE